MCIKISAPSLVFIPIACPVGKVITTLPSAGAWRTPSLGSTATPSPIAPLEKTSSFTSDSGNNSPASGLTSSVETFKSLVLAKLGAAFAIASA